jgi:hypothetical protein
MGYRSAVSSVPRVCSACGAASAWDARFCQQCGRRLDDAETTPRYYGALSPGPPFVLGCILVIAGIVALLAWSIVAAVVLLGLAVVVFVFFYEAARRNPDDAVARRVFSSARHLRGWAVFVRASTAAWTRAGREVVRLRGESRTLRREREPALRSLGDAAYREDESLVKALQARVREIDEEIARRDRARAEALATARRHVDEERDAARATQELSVDEIASGGGDDA